jgi:hypothetical protein
MIAGWSGRAAAAAATVASTGRYDSDAPLTSIEMPPPIGTPIGGGSESVLVEDFGERVTDGADELVHLGGVHHEGRGDCNAVIGTAHDQATLARCGL